MTKSKLLSLIFIFYAYAYAYANAQWIVQQLPTTNTLRDVYFADSTEGWVTGFDGIFHTINGSITWETQYLGLSIALSGLSSTEIWATGNRGKILHTTNGGIYWEEISLAQFTDLDSLTSLNNIYFYNTSIGWVYVNGWQSGLIRHRLLRTTDGGISWQMMVNPLASWGGGTAILQFFNSNDGLITGTATPVFKTTDCGITWEQLGGFSYMVTLEMQFVNRNIGWGSSDGPVLTTYVVKSTDSGENWFNNISFQCSDLSTYLSFTDTLNGWVVQRTCISGGTEIWHTSDGGTHWNLQFIYLPSFYFRPNKIFFIDSLNGWVLGENGVILHTTSGGIIPVELISFTAELIEDGVTLEWTTATETNNQGFEILRFTQNNNGWKTIGFVPGFGTTTEPNSYSYTDKDVFSGNYKYRLKQIDYDGAFNYSELIEVEVDFSPKEFVLYQNYPNPFNPTTLIKYEIAGKARHDNVMVALKVYDVLGNEVTTLVSEEKQPGVYEVEFNASSLASGIYFYQLKTDTFVQTNKMILKK